MLTCVRICLSVAESVGAVRGLRNRPFAYSGQALVFGFWDAVVPLVGILGGDEP